MNSEGGTGTKDIQSFKNILGRNIAQIWIPRKVNIEYKEMALMNNIFFKNSESKLFKRAWACVGLTCK